jgi:hypothetical protein
MSPLKNFSPKKEKPQASKQPAVDDFESRFEELAALRLSNPMEDLTQKIQDLHNYVDGCLALQDMEICDRMEFINEKDKQPSYSTDKRNTEMPVATPYGEEMMEEEVNSTEPLPVIVAITEEEKEVEEIEEDEEEDL